MMISRSFVLEKFAYLIYQYKTMLIKYLWSYIRIYNYRCMPNRKKPRKPCLVCGKEPYGSTYKYCSNTCQFIYQHEKYIQDWKKGLVSGLQRIGVVSIHIKRYLREKYSNKCCVCGWAEVNQWTGTIPLVADHIDGNWRNNSEENLRLICPNCDSLSKTYGGANRGNGRENRAVSKRAQEGRKNIQKVRRGSSVGRAVVS